MLQQLINLVNQLTTRLNSLVSNSKNITDLDAASLPLTPTDEIGFWSIIEGKMVKTTLNEFQGGSEFSDALFKIFNSTVPTKVVTFDNSGVVGTIAVKFQAVGGTVAYLTDIPNTNHYKSPVSSLSVLAGISEGDLNNLERRYVASENIDYFYISAATSGDIAPNNQTGGTGFWVRAESGSGTGDMLISNYGGSDANTVANADNLGGFAASGFATDTDITAINDLLSAQLTLIQTNQTDISGKEDDLGNPPVNGYVLSSTIAGIRSWVSKSASAQTKVEVFKATDGQTVHTVGAGVIIDDGKLKVFVGTEHWFVTNGVSGLDVGLITVNFGTGQLTFNPSGGLYLDTPVRIEYN